jgi:hypothetical protein
MPRKPGGWKLLAPASGIAVTLLVLDLLVLDLRVPRAADL